MKSSASQEGEELQIALNEDFDEDQPEGLGSEVLADLVVEQAVEDFVVEELEHKHEGHREHKEVEQVVEEQVVVPGLPHVLLVGVRVVARDVLDAGLHLVQVVAEPDNLPLLLLDERNGDEDLPDDPLVLLLVVLV